MERATKELMTVDEAYRLTKRSKAAWRADIRRRKVPVVRIGRSVRIPIEAIEKMIRAGWSDAISVDNEPAQ